MKNISLITGASSGMGKEIAMHIDTYNLDEIWAIALEADLLETLKLECKTKVVPFALDLTNTASFDVIEAALKKDKPNIVWLANCSGYAKFGKTGQITPKQNANMIDLNCTALTYITEMCIPYMTKGARILQIASLAAMQPTPYMSVYGASKAYVLSYSKALNVELKRDGISVTCICPFWTKTNFLNVAKETTDNVITHFSVLYDPKKVIAKAMRDAKKRKAVSIYGIKAKLQSLLVKILPHSVAMKVWTMQQKINKKFK